MTESELLTQIVPSFQESCFQRWNWWIEELFISTFLNVSITEVPGLVYKDWKTQFPLKNRLSHLYVGQVNYIYITMQSSPWDPEVAVVQWAHRPRVQVLVEAKLSGGCERRGQVISTYTFKSRAQPLWGSVVWPQRSTALWKRLCPQFPKYVVFQEIAQQRWKLKRGLCSQGGEVPSSNWFIVLMHAPGSAWDKIPTLLEKRPR